MRMSRSDGPSPQDSAAGHRGDEHGSVREAGLAPPTPDDNASAPQPGRSRLGPPSPGRPARAVNALEEACMFEEQPQQELDSLLKSNPEFKQLYQRHRELDKKVADAEHGVLPIDDVTLARMKREKLAAKDRLTRLYESSH